MPAPETREPETSDSEPETSDISGRIRTWVRRHARGPVSLGVNLSLTAVSVALAYFYRLRCFGPIYDPSNGATSGDVAARWFGQGCYTDFQLLWTGRQLFTDVVPYLNGGFAPDGTALPGTLEYPALSGFLAWAVALPATTDAQFYTFFAIVLGLCAMGITTLLVQLAGWRTLWWSLAPGVVLYATYNVEMFVVFFATAAIWAAVRAEIGSRHAIRWLILCGTLLGLGACAKLYPLLFAAPIALWALLPTARLLERSVWRQLQWKRLMAVIIPTLAVIAIVNVPLMIVHFDGWFAGIKFQWSRDIDSSTNAIWYWGLRPYIDSPHVQVVLRSVVSAATLIGILIPPGWGFVRWYRGGSFPWMQASAAMLMAYLVLNKVHSPQYVLWLIPFFVLLRIRWTWIIAYYIADVFVGVGFFARGAVGTYDVELSVWPQIFILGVWGRAILLFVLFFIAMNSPRATDAFIDVRADRRTAPPSRVPARSAPQLE